MCTVRYWEVTPLWYYCWTVLHDAVSHFEIWLAKRNIAVLGTLSGFLGMILYVVCCTVLYDNLLGPYCTNILCMTYCVIVHDIIIPFSMVFIEVIFSDAILSYSSIIHFIMIISYYCMTWWCGCILLDTVYTTVLYGCSTECIIYCQHNTECHSQLANQATKKYDTVMSFRDANNAACQWSYWILLLLYDREFIYILYAKPDFVINSHIFT